ncbi:MAG: nucleotidyltransferase family protein [Neisseriaceae bacterium]|nr:nucleotidyltransferase family protein [Neisseriaceae bacterium]
MKAMILAAGRGERMRPLTDKTPKPLLSLGSETLIERHIRRLQAKGFYEIVINCAYLGKQIQDFLDDGSRYGVSIAYSDEGEQGLETAGGIATALPLLGDEPFLVVNGDILTNIDFQAALLIASTLKTGSLKAHLWLVPNPPHHPQGDFGIDIQGCLTQQSPCYTFSGVAVYHPIFFEEVSANEKKPLAPLLRQGAEQNTITATLTDSLWLDVGTPERLKMAQTIVQEVDKIHSLFEAP